MYAHTVEKYEARVGLAHTCNIFHSLRVGSRYKWNPQNDGKIHPAKLKYAKLILQKTTLFSMINQLPPPTHPLSKWLHELRGLQRPNLLVTVAYTHCSEITGQQPEVLQYMQEMNYMIGRVLFGRLFLVWLFVVLFSLTMLFKGDNSCS